MPLFTIISRVSPPLILVESMDLDTNQSLHKSLRKQAKELIQVMTRSSEQTGIINSRWCYFIYLIHANVCYLTACEEGYPKKLAYSFLEEIKKEFDVHHGSEVLQTKRPYTFEAFDTFIQKTKKLYLDVKSQRNLNKVSSDLKDINEIMQRNIRDILGRSAKISEVVSKSDTLGAQAESYHKKAKHFNAQHFWRTWGPIMAGLTFIVFLFLLRVLLF
ncbi:vesicle-trafficking protein SEC22b-like [Schistocerca gregaria]|uniref:vesicle-trafficking protein SEC22b-like n=1 Tax=Schistocerca gregaria TaxID=7010 RepID=UPI00211F46F9|nr:vesicle-trafficking protein SEC22b-like [Schistocerca gregaria]